MTTQGRLGASIGAHRVTIQAFEPPPPGTPEVGPNGEPAYTPVLRIPAKYGNLNESGLQANVSSDRGENQLTFDLN